MSDALERLKNRPRPQVAKRDARIQSEGERREVEEQGEGMAIADAEVREREDERASQSQSLEEFETKQSTVRLEARVSERLQEQCRAAGICREVLIEAMFEHLEEKPKVAQSVIKVAKGKQIERQKRASLKRAKAMIEKLESS